MHKITQKKFESACVKCGQQDSVLLGHHHILDRYGNKTEKEEVICRTCHQKLHEKDLAEKRKRSNWKSPKHYRLSKSDIPI